MTTTLNVSVIADSVASVSVSNTKTYHPGETIAKSDITVTLTWASGKTPTTTNEFTFADDGYQFTYNDAPSGGSNGVKQFSIVYGGTTYNFTVSVSRVAPQNSIGVSDALTRSTTGISNGSTSYSNWSGKKVSSDAVYAGNSAGSNDSIQLRSNNSNSGIVMTSSGGKVAKITVVWNSETANGRVLDIYGKNTAYSAATDLYSSSTQGTKLGSITYGSSTELTISGDYAYIGIRSNSGALYLTSVTISFAGSENPSNVANYIMYEDTENQCTSKLNNAVERLNTMSASDKNTFWTSNDYVISTARTRLQAWAVHEGKTLTYSSGSFVLSSNNYGLISGETNHIAVFTVVIALAGISLIPLAYFFIRKRKHQ